ncbi:MAG: hypothetical protein ACHQHM_00375 [Thermoanaerobaculales bacterium]
MRAALAAVPGAVIVLATLAGWAPALRDLPDYFAPLRHRTAQVIAGTQGPFWNPDSGCGEPFFANPQSGVLYPFTWLAAVVPAPTAVWLEVGIHLAILALGASLLARRLLAPPWLEVAAGWGVALAGPTLDAAGVLNNLETLAWLPWLWWAALGGAWRQAALFGALAYLGAEPQLALVGFLVAAVLAPRRQTMVGLALALGLVAVQALPFAAWVQSGDRGSGRELDALAAGAVRVAELPAFALPGAPLEARSDRYVRHPTLPLWVVSLGVIAVVAGSRQARLLAVAGWALLAASVIPSVRNGDVLWAAVTCGLVRYPGRLVFPAVVALVVAAAASVRRRSAWAAAVAVGVVSAGAVAVGAGLTLTVVEGTTAALVATGWGAPAAAAAITGELALAPLLRDIVDLPSMHTPVHRSCLDAQLDSRGRVYTVQPSKQQLAWVGADAASREIALGLGYLALEDGRQMVRTFAPLQSRAFAAHLAEADKGPAELWWLDSLAATRVVSHHPVPRLRELCRDGELRVYANSLAWPETSVVHGIPAPGQEPVPAGQILTATPGHDRQAWTVQVAPAGGVLLWLATPDPGWHYRVDGRQTHAVTGPGIIHGVPVPAGCHEVTATYRPTGFVAGAAVSVLSAMLLLGSVALRRWGRLERVSERLSSCKNSWK